MSDNDLFCIGILDDMLNGPIIIGGIGTSPLKSYDILRVLLDEFQKGKFV